MNLLELPKAIWDAIDTRIEAAIDRMRLKIKREIYEELSATTGARAAQIDAELKAKG